MRYIICAHPCHASEQFIFSFFAFDDDKTLFQAYSHCHRVLSQMDAAICFDGYSRVIADFNSAVAVAVYMMVPKNQAIQPEDFEFHRMYTRDTKLTVIAERKHTFEVKEGLLGFVSLSADLYHDVNDKFPKFKSFGGLFTCHSMMQYSDEYWSDVFTKAHEEALG
jgi:hypothetical protein